MAQQRSLATAEDCGQALALSRKRDVPDRVDTAMNTVKPRRVCRVSESFSRIPELPELPRRDNPMLLPRQLRQRLVTSPFLLHTDY
jgi:hypothetical protein